MLTMRSSAILVINGKTATRFDPIMIFRTLVKNLVVRDSHTGIVEVVQFATIKSKGR